ncbi:hypothetical protein G6F49_011975 [Rhizopus delemar]|nr:hypothetical protein G6F54_010045 [Rhizopus delemar]KAG1541066.1 hypothetical protein G6F49_011975 [Rhizopus delemar]KAG1579884.1 hypothetical protein G6F48_010835 [Rhizopus delemar]KAG1628511.1 hypothetical protein G6F44_011890 [Rhizopus delemar]
MPKSRFKPAEYSWLKANYDHFNHILFFDAFSSYTKNRAGKRFLVLAHQWIDDPSKREALLNNFNKWRKSKEAKEYWKNRADLVYSESETSSSNSTYNSSSPSIVAQPSVATNITEEMDSFFSANLTLPSKSNRYVVDGVDISSCFNKYQVRFREAISFNGIAFETHFHQILSLSSILLLQKNYSNDDLAICFPEKSLEIVRSNVKEDLNTKNYNVPYGRIITILSIVERVYGRSISREQGCFEMDKAMLESDGIEKTIIKTFKKMLETFLMDDLEETVKEDDLKSRFILPIIQSLFDDIDSPNTYHFKISNENNHECQNKQFDISRRRPDGYFRANRNGSMVTIGFFEAKPASQKKDAKRIQYDLVRLGVFGKNAIDIHQLGSSFLVQAVGTKMSFYMLQKKTSDIYTMVELDTLTFPSTVNEIPAIFGYINRIAKIVGIFNDIAKVIVPVQDDEGEVRQSLRSPIIRGLSLHK